MSFRADGGFRGVVRLGRCGIDGLGGGWSGMGRMGEDDMEEWCGVVWCWVRVYLLHTQLVLAVSLMYALVGTVGME